jgi:nitroreductase
VDFKDLAKERYSLREFSDKSIEREKLDLVLRAGQLAPTARNQQPQRILVIEDKDALNSLKECTPYLFNAPTVLIVFYNKNIAAVRKYDNKSYGEVDAAIVTTQIMLQAADLGLGTTFVGHFDPKLLIEKFNIPENIIPVGVLPIGYPAEGAEPSLKHNERYPIEQTVFYNQF